MTGNHGPFGGNTTYAGFAVTTTACLCAFLVVLTACVLLLNGDIEAGREALLQGAGVLGIAVALLSRTRQDPAATVDQPANITATSVADEPELRAEARRQPRTVDPDPVEDDPDLYGRP